MTLLKVVSYYLSQQQSATTQNAVLWWFVHNGVFVDRFTKYQDAKWSLLRQIAIKKKVPFYAGF